MNGKIVEVAGKLYVETRWTLEDAPAIGGLRFRVTNWLGSKPEPGTVLRYGSERGWYDDSNPIRANEMGWRVPNVECEAAGQPIESLSIAPPKVRGARSTAWRWGRWFVTLARSVREVEADVWAAS